MERPQGAGFSSVKAHVQKCKPWDWNDLARAQNEDQIAIDLTYEATVEAFQEIGISSLKRLGGKSVSRMSWSESDSGP